MSKRKLNLEWNVYISDFNSKKIKTYNIFNHGSFAEDVKKLCKEDITKEEFSEKLRKCVQYRYWSKAEWEIILTSWPPYIDEKELDRLNTEHEEYKTKWGHSPYALDVRPTVGEKIDVYDQVMLNWSAFIDYVWNNK